MATIKLVVLRDTAVAFKLMNEDTAVKILELQLWHGLSPK